MTARKSLLITLLTLLAAPTLAQRPTPCGGPQCQGRYPLPACCFAAPPPPATATPVGVPSSTPVPATATPASGPTAVATPVPTGGAPTRIDRYRLIFAGREPGAFRIDASGRIVTREGWPLVEFCVELTDGTRLPCVPVGQVGR